MFGIHPPFLGDLRLAGPYLSLAGEKAKSRNRPDQGQTSDFAREGLGQVSANGTVPLSRKI
ncbi:hypothetical protein ASC71_19595 [Rhizobium sp. Root1240]|nr:hypothetical protein ASC71_19595 [Rhizobium sp. Root1240]